MVSASTSSARRKLAWGIDEARVLCREAHAYENASAYEVRTKKSVTGERITYRCYAAEQTPPPEHWPLLAGDAVHNLRASLDHAVWDATPEPDRSKRTQFPIFTDASGFEKAGRPIQRHGAEGRPGEG